ncbi:ABC-type spermidine/putrescine transport system permease subunit II [Bradyrhizobium sp. USDA 4532]|uniref:ABC transporter permease n=1 Tax=unclassified Bradyrhizobium TaxID=2631580 RepID=UPI0020A1EF15|nr:MULTISPECIES: hypothetical protein [unclassified Bradyrhizobium]MCP1835584.1 ABC-type spermidine/putrescine transport system permease subunit II [Bradyrhizobium sp. USDA 4545]MCP1920333.1 ABC-type spermidine/putrescine transport system permease subunit II [Bradyrhizobium sp. USDA 4532]
MSTLWTSTYVEATLANIALWIGLAGAFAINLSSFRTKAVLPGLAFSPLIVPAVVLCIALLQLFAWLRLTQTIYLVLAIPYVVPIPARLAPNNQQLERAAMNLLAMRLQLIRRTGLPLNLPALLSAAIFAFVTWSKTPAFTHFCYPACARQL